MRRLLLASFVAAPFAVCVAFANAPAAEDAAGPPAHKTQGAVAVAQSAEADEFYCLQEMVSTKDGKVICHQRWRTSLDEACDGATGLPSWLEEKTVVSRRKVGTCSNGKAVMQYVADCGWAGCSGA